MNFIIACLGTHGDLWPFVGLGTELKARGHRVTILSNAVFEGLVLEHGLDFHPIATAEAYKQAFETGITWHDGGNVEHPFLLQNHPAIQPAFEHVYRRITSGEQPIVLSSGNTFGVRFACEKLNYPWVATSVYPLWLRSRVNPPYPLPNGLPKPILDFCYWYADRFRFDPKICRLLNETRSSLGMPPIRRVFHQWHAAAALHLALYPEWFGPPVVACPQNIRMTGFSLWEPDVVEEQVGLKEFLAEHGPAVLFTTGTGISEVSAFFSESLRLCEQLNVPGIFVSSYLPETQLSRHVPIFSASRLRMSQVLPQCRAIVHHGGVGTAAQAIASGVPQLISPLAFDQPDNARRVRKLGLGDSISRRDYLRGCAQKPLAELLKNASYRLNAERYSKKLAGQDSLQVAADLLESLRAG